MTQRKCPQCDGVMTDLYTFRGWGREGFYVCDTCGHTQSIYEENTTIPYLLFILFEGFLFWMDSRVSPFEYTLYSIVFLFLVYGLYHTIQASRNLDMNYPVIGEAIDTFQPNEIQTEALKHYIEVSTHQGTWIKRFFALFLVVAYSVMFSREANLTTIDYLGYVVIAIILPLWLLFSKFDKGPIDTK